MSVTFGRPTGKTSSNCDALCVGKWLWPALVTMAALAGIWALQQPTSVKAVLEREEHRLFVAGKILLREPLDGQRIFALYRNWQE